jgi:hypothetical protein
MHHHKKAAREEYGFQQRDSDAWNPPDSYYSRPISPPMHLTPGAGQLKAFYLPRMIHKGRNEPAELHPVHNTSLRNRQPKRSHSDLETTEKLVDEVLKQMELHSMDESSGIDYKTAQRCARKAVAIQHNPSGIDPNLARRCAASAIHHMQQQQDSIHHAPGFNQMEDPSDSTTAEMRRRAAHTAAMRRRAAHTTAMRFL